MKIAPYISKLSTSPEYRDFTKKNSDAFMVAAFFILDLENNKNQHVIDYYVPSKKKIAAFTLDNHITMQMMDLMTKKTPEKLDLKTNVDLDTLQGILEDEMKNRNITDEIKKIIAVVQNINGKKIWNLNCMLSGMGILNAHVEDATRTVLRMEKKSFMDLMRKLPVEEIKQQMAAAQGALKKSPLAQAAPEETEESDEEKQDSSPLPPPPVSPTKNQKPDINAQLQKALAAIEKEKAQMLKESKKPSPKKAKKK